AFAAGADLLQVVGDRLAVGPRSVGGGHVRRLGMVEGDVAALHRADHHAGLVDIAGEQVGSHAVDDAVGEDAVLVAAVDEMHAAVRRVDVVQGNPAGYAAVFQV